MLPPGGRSLSDRFAARRPCVSSPDDPVRRRTTNAEPSAGLRVPCRTHSGRNGVSRSPRRKASGCALDSRLRVMLHRARGMTDKGGERKAPTERGPPSGWCPKTPARRFDRLSDHTASPGDGMATVSSFPRRRESRCLHSHSPLRLEQPARGSIIDVKTITRKRALPWHTTR